MVVASAHACKYSKWYWLNQSSGEVRPYNCGSWSCDQHKAATAYSWACRVALATPERMLTLTNIPSDKKAAYWGFQQLVTAIRREGMRFEYCRFLEVGAKTGMRHFHLAQRGDFIPVKWLSIHAAANGLGKIVHAEKCYGQGPAFYLSKYITKDDVLLPGWRKVASSRGFFRARELPADLRADWVLKRVG